MLSVENKLKNLKEIKTSLTSIIIVLFVTICFSANSEEKLKSVELGGKNTKITVKVFSSLTCPHCATFHKNIFSKLKKEFIDSDVVKFEHHGFPLDLAALNAEKILRCINESKNRLNFLDEIYQKQNEWASGNDINSINSELVKISKKYGLNDVKVEECLKNEKLENLILESRINGSKKYSIQSTPTILINEKVYKGKNEYNDFRREIKKLL